MVDDNPIHYSELDLRSPQARTILEASEVTELLPICSAWRGFDQDEARYDIRGDSLMLPLIDFGSVFKVRYEAPVLPPDISILNETQVSPPS